MSQAIFTSGTSQLQRIIPCFPGYAMGGIIRTGELELPHLQQQIVDLSHQIEINQTQKDEVLKRKREEENPLVINYTMQNKKLQKTLEKTCKNLKEFQEEKEESPFSETMLPIDYDRSCLDYRHRSDESESMHFIIIKRQSAQAQISSFTKHLTKMRYLPAVVDLVDQVTETILSQAKEEDQEVCLLGSFITLSRVRVIDPIVIREDAVLSQEIRKEQTASKYSVISETILGGVFIGFGSRISKIQNVDTATNDPKSITSKLTTFSFVSQGAIPSTNNFDLWTTYNNWKEKLTTNPHCGFPIAFKVRNLTDVLKENNLLQTGKEI
jgi:hypothetical protein